MCLQCLVIKLPSYGLPGKLCHWIKNFLPGRLTHIPVDGSSSKTHLVNGGVPQGSVSSPTLFILHLNNILKESYIFAGDSTLFNDRWI